jgi:hypothetical protein
VSKASEIKSQKPIPKKSAHRVIDDKDFLEDEPLEEFDDDLEDYLDDEG